MLQDHKTIGRAEKKKKMRAGPCLESSFSGIQSWVPVVVWVEIRSELGRMVLVLGGQLDSNGFSAQTLPSTGRQADIV